MLVVNTTDLHRIEEDDIYEHIADLYSTRATNDSSLGLGYLSRTDEVDIELGQNKVLHIKQSISSFNDSNKTKSGTTGFVTWSISPLFARWILNVDQRNSLESRNIININQLSQLNVLELGAGVSGVLTSSIGLHCRKYIATDQSNLLKVLKTNIEQNVDIFFDSNTLTSTSTSSFKKKSGSKKATISTSHIPRLEVLEYDWELSDPEVLLESFEDGYPDLIIACDTIYNEYLIPHFLKSIETLSDKENTGIIVGVQLRDSDVLERFLEAVITDFKFNCFCVPEFMLTDKLQNGYSIYYLTKS